VPYTGLVRSGLVDEENFTGGFRAGL